MRSLLARDLNLGTMHSFIRGCGILEVDQDIQSVKNEPTTSQEKCSQFIHLHVFIIIIIIIIKYHNFQSEPGLLETKSNPGPVFPVSFMLYSLATPQTEPARDSLSGDK